LARSVAAHIDPDSVFRHVAVGIDGTPASLEACRQAGALADESAAIELVAVVHLAQAARVGMDAPRVADELTREAEDALAEALRVLGGRGTPHFVDGVATQALLREVERVDASVVAVGSHGHRRATEILIGGVTGELLHTAPCSVLVARRPERPEAFPRSLVVGIDGSREGDLALGAAQELARRLDVPLRVLVALRGKGIDRAQVHLRAPLAETLDEAPVPALVEASRATDLVVVGSRGLHGLRALGSVSERVAHQAGCSVLVVRPRLPR